MGFREIFSQLELRVYIILSLVLQVLPILWSYYRKRISSRPFQRILWLTAFLAADFVATLSLGAIFHLNINPKSTSNKPENKYLLALWAPFILLHLGKHSRITTFTLAENEFWLSHFIRFVYHELTALCICILASNETRVRFSSIILFLTGTIKFGERIIAMKRGSMSELRISTFKKADPGFDRSYLKKFNDDNKAAQNRGQLETAALPSKLDEDQPTVASKDKGVKFLCAAYHSFNKHKGLYIDPNFTYGVKEDVGEFFRYMDIAQALNLVEVELGFAYDLFYTKTTCFHLIWGWIVRFVNLIFILSALISFLRIEKQGFLKPDVQITYTLLGVALFLEIESFLESMGSNRTKVQIGLREGRNWRRFEYLVQYVYNSMKELRNRIFQRPVTLMGQFNMLSYCFNDNKSCSFVKWVLNTFELKELWNNYYYTYYYPIDNHMKLKIFDGVRIRLQKEEKVPKINSVITSTLFHQLPHTDALQEKFDNDQFEQRLLVWHFATNLCYRIFGAEDQVHLQNAKYLSDYVMYLLAIRPSMLSSVTTAELKSYRNAYATCVQFYSDYKIINDGVQVYEELEKECKYFHRIEQEDRVQRNTLLWDGFEVAYELNTLAAEEKIRVCEFLFEVWVDMLCFAASNIHGKEHAERLGTGGEFITYIWLFRLHWNLNSRYEF